MKKLSAVLAALAVAAALTACGGSDDEAESDAPVTENSTGTTAPAEDTEELDGNSMGDDGDASSDDSEPTTEDLDGNSMGDDNSGGTQPTTEELDGNSMGD